MELIDRRAECEVLDLLVEDVRDGKGRALVLRGEPGIGKSALLEYLTEHAPGCRVERAAGAQSEMELAFAGLHQLCARMLDQFERFPVPQHDALRSAFGMNAGPTPDRFLVGLAVLGLLSEIAEEQPLVCLVDDEQWLDRASAQVLAFVARRLGAESLGLVFATRVPSEDLAGLPELVIRGLPDADARVLLDSVLAGRIDARVRHQILAETRGNPLAVLELPRRLTVAELAGGFGLPSAMPLAGSIEASFQRRISALPHQTRRLLLLGAADPTGDPALVWRAAERFEIGGDSSAAAVDAGLAEFGTRVRFRHPLARSAAYWSASIQDRQQAHRALAEVTDPRLDPDRRAWHRAQGASGPDEDVAAELERSAGRARARGGLGAAAAFLMQSATLTLDPRQRARRALDATQAQIQAGAFDVARDLLAMAESEALSDLQQAHADLLRAQIAFNNSRGGDAPLLLLKAARRLEPIDVALSRETYLDALSATIFAGPLAAPGGDVREVARAAIAAPPVRRPTKAPDLLLDGTAAGLHVGYAAGVPVLRRALADFGTGMSVEEELRWMWLACITAMRIWDDERWDTLTARYVHLARQTGALSELPLALTARAFMLLFAGELSAAASLTDELHTVNEATGGGLAPYGAMGVAALRGEIGAAALVDATIKEVTRRGEGTGITFANWADAVLNNGLGRYEKAAAAGRHATAYDKDLALLCWSSVELIEAATRCGMTDIAVGAYRQLTEMANATGTDWAVGAQARSYALMSEGEIAERLYREAITRLGRTRIRVDLARARLVYGEWLRRERRRGDAREQLHTAHRMFEAMGMEAFAERAHRELRATSESSRIRTTTARHAELTAQEIQIARLARDGLSNPEIATRLFISARTVQYHLRKIFAKLGITSRTQLDRALPGAIATVGRQ